MGKRGDWQQRDVDNAVDLIYNRVYKNASVAARCTGTSKATMYRAVHKKEAEDGVKRKLKAKVGDARGKRGRKQRVPLSPGPGPLLMPIAESRLKDVVTRLADEQFVITPTVIKMLCLKFLEDNPMYIGFHDMDSDSRTRDAKINEWYSHFMNRYPKIRRRLQDKDDGGQGTSNGQAKMDASDGDSGVSDMSAGAAPAKEPGDSENVGKTSRCSNRKRDIYGRRQI